MKVLVLGSGGQVGRAVLAAAPPDCQLLGLSHSDLDIIGARAVEALLAHEDVDWIVNAAAYTQVDAAEDEPERAAAINDRAVGALARAADGMGARLLHLSTDFVFDGRASRPYTPLDAAHPSSVYGATKRAGEIQALSSGTHVVLRTSWVYASQGHNFVLTMLRLMRERTEIRIVNDQTGSPTWAASLAHALWAFMRQRAGPGIYHFSDAGQATWFEFAAAIQEGALERGLLSSKAMLVPIRTGEYPAKAVRPAFSALDSASALAIPGVCSAPWRDNLRMMLDEVRAQ